MPKAHAFQAWVKAAYLSHNTFFIPSASPCLQAWVVDLLAHLPLGYLLSIHVLYVLKAKTGKLHGSRGGA
jgi:hypothetical protein